MQLGDFQAALPQLVGVPVLSMRGRRFISHQGETILHNIGLPEWVAADGDDYVEKAAALRGMWREWCRQQPSDVAD